MVNEVIRVCSAGGKTLNSSVATMKSHPVHTQEIAFGWNYVTNGDPAQEIDLVMTTVTQFAIDPS